MDLETQIGLPMEYESARQSAYWLLLRCELQGLWYSKVLVDLDTDERVTMEQVSHEDPIWLLEQVKVLVSNIR
jgi:hypothetical protein